MFYRSGILIKQNDFFLFFSKTVTQIKFYQPPIATFRSSKSGVPQLFHAMAPQTALASGRGPLTHTNRQCYKIYQETHQLLDCVFLLLFAAQ